MLAVFSNLIGRCCPVTVLLPETACFIFVLFQKPGKWCAVHVRIAWEIYHHQQKQNSDKGSDSKPSDPLRPPSHLLQGPSLARPPDLSSSASSSILGKYSSFVWLVMISSCNKGLCFTYSRQTTDKLLRFVLELHKNSTYVNLFCAMFL